MGLRLFLASLSQQDFIIDHRTIHIHITTKLTIKNSFTKINELTFCLHSSVTLVFDLLIYILLRLKWNNFDGRLRCPIDMCCDQCYAARCLRSPRKVDLSFNFHFCYCILPKFNTICYIYVLLVI